MKHRHINITERDHDVFAILKHLPLTTNQLYRVSQLFSEPFASEQRVYRRLRKLAAAGMLRRYYFAFPNSGRNPAYWRLTHASYQCVVDRDQTIKPRRSTFSSIGVSLHFHSHQLTELMISLFISAKQQGIEISQLQVEQPIRLDSCNTNLEQTQVPDATFSLYSPENQTHFKFFVELDTASERIATNLQVPSSIQKKLDFYERYRKQSDQAFRVLFVTTSSKQRAENILKFSRQLSHNPAARLVYAAYLPDLLNRSNVVVEPAFFDERMQQICLIRKPRFCRLFKPSQTTKGSFKQLMQKDFQPFCAS